MKKKMRRLIVLFASILCIGAIGAVSYAAWANGKTSHTVAQMTVGSLTVLGLDADAAVTTDIGSKTLMPVDQGAIGSEETKVVAITVKVTKASANYKITAAATFSENKGLVAESGLYIVADAPTFETNGDLKEELSTFTGGTKLSGTAQDVATGSAFAEGAGVSVEHIFYLVLDSSNINDMNAEFALTFTIVVA